MFTQVADFISGWGAIYDNLGNLIGAFSIGFGWLLRLWR